MELTRFVDSSRQTGFGIHESESDLLAHNPALQPTPLTRRG